jgi:hypothetical protein
MRAPDQGNLPQQLGKGKGKETKELIFTLSNGDPKELPINTKKQLLNLSDQFVLFIEVKLKQL